MDSNTDVHITEGLQVAILHFMLREGISKGEFAERLVINPTTLARWLKPLKGEEGNIIRKEQREALYALVKDFMPLIVPPTVTYSRISIVRRNCLVPDYDKRGADYIHTFDTRGKAMLAVDKNNNDEWSIDQYPTLHLALKQHRDLVEEARSFDLKYDEQDLSIERQDEAKNLVSRMGFWYHEFFRIYTQISNSEAGEYLDPILDSMLSTLELTEALISSYAPLSRRNKMRVAVYAEGLREKEIKCSK